MFEKQDKEYLMLVLSRKIGERVNIGNDITVYVVEICGNKVRLGFEAPKTTPIDRCDVNGESQRQSNKVKG
jgi:carbon storage regulator